MKLKAAVTVAKTALNPKTYKIAFKGCLISLIMLGIMILLPAIMFIKLPTILFGSIFDKDSGVNQEEILDYYKNIPNNIQQGLDEYVENLTDKYNPDSVEVIGEETVTFNWQELVAIDTVRHEQKFDAVSQKSIESLADKFVSRSYEVKTNYIKVPDKTVIENGKRVVKSWKRKKKVKLIITNKYKTMNEVLTLLDLEKDEQDLVYSYLEGAYSIEGDFDLPEHIDVVAVSIFAHPAPDLDVITSPYGWRFNRTEFHTGIDLSSGDALGKPIIAAADGTVTFAGFDNNGGGGNMVTIKHSINGKTYKTKYMHLSIIKVSEKQVVSTGDVIGACGSTGRSTGPHLHFQINTSTGTVNPYPYIFE